MCFPISAKQPETEATGETNLLPQNSDTLWPIFIAFLVIALVVALIDLVILWRWIAFQNRLNRAIAQYGCVYDESPPEGWTPPGLPPLITEEPYPVSIGETPDILSAPTTLEDRDREVTEDTSIEPPPPPPEPVIVPRPFAKTWSLVHPFLGFQFVLLMANTLAAIPVLVAIPFLPGGLVALSKPNSEAMKMLIIVATIFGLFVQNGLFVGVVGFFLKQYRLAWQSIGLGRPTRNQILLGLGIGVAMFTLASGAESLLYALAEKLLSPRALENLKELSDSFNAATLYLQLPNPVMKVLFAIGGAVAAPIGEEIFFRGLLFNTLRIRYNLKLAIVVSSLAFALVHASPLAVVVIFPMGMLLAYVYHRTHSLWVTIVIHAVNNGLSFLLLSLLPPSGH
jgi:membrane protease YdiL (CAAX protease family)